MKTNTAKMIEAHRMAGRTFVANGVKSFVRERGTGPAVVCMHGMWGSSFLYRKVIDELAKRNMRGICWDLPGFGLADRPKDYDYSWTGLGRFAAAAVEELELERFHLVVHDIGGPVGFELAAAQRGRVASITVLNTMIDVTAFKPPWTMKPFRHRGIGELWLAGMNKPLFRWLMMLQGIGDRDSISKTELGVYLDLMRVHDRGRAFLKTMRSTERTSDKQALYRSTLRNVPYPVQVVWAASDPALKLGSYGELARRAVGLNKIETVPGKHFLQEDQAPAIADYVVAIANRGNLVPAEGVAPRRDPL